MELLPFAFSTALIIDGIDTERCWKLSSEVLVHIVTIWICWLNICDADILLQNIPNRRYWIEM